MICDKNRFNTIEYLSPAPALYHLCLTGAWVRHFFGSSSQRIIRTMG